MFPTTAAILPQAEFFHSTINPSFGSSLSEFPENDYSNLEVDPLFRLVECKNYFIFLSLEYRIALQELIKNFYDNKDSVKLPPAIISVQSVQLICNYLESEDIKELITGDAIFSISCEVLMQIVEGIKSCCSSEDEFEAIKLKAEHLFKSDDLRRYFEYTYENREIIIMHTIEYLKNQWKNEDINTKYHITIALFRLWLITHMPSTMSLQTLNILTILLSPTTNADYTPSKLDLVTCLHGTNVELIRYPQLRRPPYQTYQIQDPIFTPAKQFRFVQMTSATILASAIYHIPFLENAGEQQSLRVARPITKMQNQLITNQIYLNNNPYYKKAELKPEYQSEKTTHINSIFHLTIQDTVAGNWDIPFYLAIDDCCNLLLLTPATKQVFDMTYRLYNLTKRDNLFPEFEDSLALTNPQSAYFANSLVFTLNKITARDDANARFYLGNPSGGSDSTTSQKTVCRSPYVTYRGIEDISKYIPGQQCSEAKDQNLFHVFFISSININALHEAFCIG